MESIRDVKIKKQKKYYPENLINQDILKMDIFKKNLILILSLCLK
jgi:hypothetical protein